MKQTQQIKPPIPHGSHVDCSASLTKLTALQASIPILSVRVCTPDLGFTGGNTDIVAGTDTDLIGACTPALTVFGISASQPYSKIHSEFYHDILLRH
jgi:hypothetical protein